MTSGKRLNWIRKACDWSDFQEPTETYGDDERMVFVENGVRYPGIAGIVEQGSATYIGRYTNLSGGCLMSAMLTIGRHCSVSNNVLLGGGNHHMDYLTTGEIPGEILERTYYSDAEESYRADDFSGFTRIGCDVWIGANACILRGRSVGTGACIGAGSVVTADIPPYAVAVGNPARVIRYRFPEPIVESLLKTRWWTLPEHIVKSLPYKDISLCVEVLEEIRDIAPAT